MPVDPFLELLLSSLPPLPDPIDDFDAWRAQGAEAAEAMVAQLTEAGPEVARIEDLRLPVGDATIDLRIYWPSAPGPHPAHVFLHGGGFVAGSIHETFVDTVCRERCVGAQCVVVAVNYRKAPEHQAPTAVNDCHAALMWLVENATHHDVRSDRITLGGQSAGANLVAALCLKLRDEAGPRVALQLLEVPVLDLTLSQPSYTSLATGYGLETADVRRLVGWYVGSATEAARHPYVSPLLADDLSGLPRAHVMSAEYDPVRDDGELYVRRLNEAGVPATFSLQRGQIHVSGSLTKVMAAARSWREDALTVLREVNQSTSVPSQSQIVSTPDLSSQGTA